MKFKKDLKHEPNPDEDEDQEDPDPLGENEDSDVDHVKTQPQDIEMKVLFIFKSEDYCMTLKFCQITFFYFVFRKDNLLIFFSC